MDSSLSSKLSQFFDHLLGDDDSTFQPPNSKYKESRRTTKSKSLVSDVVIETKDSSHAKRKKKKGKSRVMDNAVEMKNNPVFDSGEKPDVMVVKKSSKNKKNKENRSDLEILEKHNKCKSDGKTRESGKNFTEDGFRIASEIPEDDSDVSDAFECDSDDYEDEPTQNCNQEHKEKQVYSSTREPRETEDGFKIVTEIPTDDSDVSDAFCEDDCEDVEQDLLTEGQQVPVQRTIKKPILQMMDDFGIDGSSLLQKQKQSISEASIPSKKLKHKKGNTNTLTYAAKKKQQKEVIILDYTRKRGSGKKRDVPDDEENISQLDDHSSQEVLDEKEIKRFRYDVFKFGMSGFHKEKKQNTRVALAIKLGAKPPKKKAVSYKDLIITKKEEKKKELEERERKQTMGLQVSKPTQNKPKGRKKIKGFSSQIGQYKNGMQVLSKKDLAKIKAS